MSTTKKEPFIAPFEYFVVENGVSRIHNLLVQEIVTYREVTKHLYWVILALTPESQKKLEKDFQDLDAILSGKIQVYQDDKTRKLFSRIVEDLMAELHQNYLTNAKTAHPMSEERPRLG